MKRITLLPGEKHAIPSPKCQCKTGRWDRFLLFPHIARIEDGFLIGEKKGSGLLFCEKSAGRRWIIGLFKVQVTEKPAFFQIPLVTHALGGLEHQYTYCNALEGLKQSIDSRVPFLETDLILTSDSHLVCSHGWTKKTYKLTGVPYPASHPVMSLETFLNTKIHGRFTTVNASKIAEAMEQYPDLLVEADLRTLDRETASRTAKKLVETFVTPKDLSERLLVQVGSPEMYEGIDSVFHFPNYQYFVHKTELKDIGSVIRFCREKGILSLALRDDYLTAEILKASKENGLCVLVYTVDDVSRAKELLKLGVDTVCSNFLQIFDLT